jgi:hypothetical protein
MSSLEAVVRELRMAQVRSSAVRYTEHAVVLFAAWIVAVLIWSRLTPVEQTVRLAAWGLPVAVGLFAIAWIVAMPRPIGLMRAADSALDLKERLSTAWERRLALGPMDEPLRRDALAQAGRTRLAAAFPIRLRGDEALAIVVLAAAAAALALVPNSMDQVLAQRHADRAAQAHASATINAAQKKLAAASSPAPVDPQVQKILQDAQARIASAPDPRSAIQNITPAEQHLLQLADPQTPARASSAQNLANNLSNTAAGRSVAQSIDASPSQGAQSLRSLASQLQSLSPAQRAELAAALAAASKQAQDPAMAAAMQQASGALARGDLAAASQDLNALAGQLDSLQQQMSNDQEIAAAINSLEAARQQLATQADRDASQTSATASPASGTPSGSPGTTSGSANGNGNGTGSGNGSGTGNGNGSGNGTGNGGSGGTGGTGTSGSGAGSGSSAQSTERVYVPGQPLPGQSEADPAPLGPGQDVPLTPYTQVIQEYEQAALTVTSQTLIPGSEQDLIREYFSSLGEQTP